MNFPMPADPEEEEAARSDGSGAFPTTQWSMVIRAGTDSTSQAHASLETLCRQYWFPLYTFIRRQGRSHHEAEDCTQEFLSRLLAGDGLARARPESGRFRTFLLTALSNFLTTEWRRAQTAKRGSGIAPISLEFSSSISRAPLEPPDPNPTPEQAFDRAWARCLIDRAAEELAAEYQRSGRGAVFDVLAPLIWGQASAEALAQQADRLNMSIETFTVALHRARRRLGNRMRAMVAETVANPEEIDVELRYLASVLGDAR